MGVPSRSGDPREHNWDRTPTHSHRNLDPRGPGLPRPGRAPGAFPAAVATSESTTGKASPTPARSRPPPRAPGAFPAAVGTPESTTGTAPHPRQDPIPNPRRPSSPRPWRTSHLHQGLQVSPAPTPGAKRGSRTSLLLPGQTRGQYIHPTETIQAVSDLGIKRGLQKGKMT